MNQWNPYAPPTAQITEGQDARCSRDGNVVVVPVGSDLPPRCIRCNAPAKAPIKEVKLYWHSPLLYLLILVNILVYAIAGLIARRTFKVSPGLCETHSAQRQQRMWIFVGGGTASCAIGIGFLSAKNSELAIVFLVLGFIALIVGAIASRKVYAKEITKEYARVAGCKEPFLASLERHRPALSR